MLPVSDMRQVHEWFLHRGLPLVLTRRVRSRALIERSLATEAGRQPVRSPLSLAEQVNVVAVMVVSRPRIGRSHPRWVTQR
jgi:hypothetical protein